MRFAYKSIAGPAIAIALTTPNFGCAGALTLFVAAEPNQTRYSPVAPSASITDEIKIVLVRQADVWRMPKMLLGAGLGYGLDYLAASSIAGALKHGTGTWLYPLLALDTAYVVLFGFGDRPGSREVVPSVWLAFKQGGKTVRVETVRKSRVDEDHYVATVTRRTIQDLAKGIVPDDVAIMIDGSPRGSHAIYSSADSPLLASAIRSIRDDAAAEQAAQAARAEARVAEERAEAARQDAEAASRAFALQRALAVGNEVATAASPSPEPAGPTKILQEAKALSAKGRHLDALKHLVAYVNKDGEISDVYSDMSAIVMRQIKVYRASGDRAAAFHLAASCVRAGAGEVPIDEMLKIRDACAIDVVNDLKLGIARGDRRAYTKWCATVDIGQDALTRQFQAKVTGVNGDAVSMVGVGVRKGEGVLLVGQVVGRGGGGHLLSVSWGGITQRTVFVQGTGALKLSEGQPVMLAAVYEGLSPYKKDNGFDGQVMTFRYKFSAN